LMVDQEMMATLVPRETPGCQGKYFYKFEEKVRK
jgi:hypothetical protein